MDLRTYMQTRNLSDEEMAARVGCSTGAMRKWRYGERTPRPKQIAAIVKATNGQVSANDLLFRKGAA